MRSFAAGKIDVYFGPTELGAPDDLEQAIVDFVDGATSSLNIAVQEIDSLTHLLTLEDVSAGLMKRGGR